MILRSFFFLLLFAGLNCCAQQLPMTSINHNSGNYIDVLFTAEPSIKNVTLAEVGGTPYYTNEFVSATVILRSGKTFEDVWIKVDLFSNEILFIKDNDELVLQSALKVYYYERPNDTTSLQTLFQSGFPLINKNHPATFYKVEAGGKNIFLLCHKGKKLSEFYNGYQKLKKFEDDESWYVFTAETGIKSIKLNRKQIEAAFPKYIQKLQSLVIKYDLNLNRKDDIIKLIGLLDAQ